MDDRDRRARKGRRRPVHTRHMIRLYHHPFSRAAGVLWALEEVGEPYEIVNVDILKGGQKAADLVALNPMGKLPVLVDRDAVITESAAISLYLADRYAHGRLAPRFDDPRRAPYLRWTLFAPSVIEPGLMARLGNWPFKPGQAGWGDYDAMLTAIDAALGGGAFICGDMFTIADVVMGGTLRYMITFDMLKPSAVVEAYVARLNQRPALKRADARNDGISKELGLK